MLIHSKFIRRTSFINNPITLLYRFLSKIPTKTDNGNSFFITTPIFYVNNSPHLGHFYTLCLADASARFQKIIGKEKIIFSTGTDEHGMKIQQAANEQGIEPIALCDKISPKFRKLCDSTNISYTDFIRTTEDRHKHVAALFFGKLKDNGFIYEGEYNGWYSVSDETFLPPLQVKEEILPTGERRHLSIETGNPVHWTNESNYMFKMSKVKDNLLYWLKNVANITPNVFHRQAISLAFEDLKDLSVSRSHSRLSWGIPVPKDDSHTLYVWFEALVNYLTVSGYPNCTMWPPNCQVLGKDILKFHAIYWPSLLLAAGLEPPRQLLVHSHWTLDGLKMSKSKGNVVCPFETIDKLTSDGFRYYLLRTGVAHSDGSWCRDSALITINAELANNLGNLHSRCVGKILNPDNEWPPLSPIWLETSSNKCKKILTLIDILPQKIEEHFTAHNFYKGIDDVMEMLRLTNSFVQQEEPWKLKNSEDRTGLNAVLHIGMLSCRAAAIALQPVIPTLAKNLLDSLNVPIESRKLSDINLASSNPLPRKLGSISHFFKRLK